jgi:ubiquinone/menaquinone biosynthesis C-methylase UbiE
VAQLEFNEETARELEVVYGRRDVLRRRRLVREALDARPGDRILDVGCGPGFYVAELLEQVGPRGAITALDGSAAMLAVAGARVAGHDNVEFHEADATALPVADESFDRALTVQVLEYVADVPAALAELHRALRPGGRLVVWDVDWSTLSLHATDRSRADRVLAAWDEHLADPVLPRTLAARLAESGFAEIAVEGHAFVTSSLDPETYGGFLVPFAADFVRGRLPDEEIDAWLAEQRDLDARGEFYFAVTQVCFAARKLA